MRAVWTIARMDIRRLFRSSKLYILVLFTLYFLHDFTRTVTTMAQTEGLGVSPFVYPLFFASWVSRIYAVLVIVVLMSDAPYLDSGQRYTGIRCGERRWAAGKIFYIFLLSVFYQLVMLAGSLVVVLPVLGLSTDWGDLLEMLAYGQDVSLTQNPAGYIVSHYQPLQAMVLTFVLAVLVSFVTGMFVFFVNGLTKSMCGTMLAVVFGLADMFITALNEQGAGLRVMNVMSWMDISGVYAGTPVDGKTSFYGLCIRLLVFAAVLGAGVLVLVRTRRIDLSEEK